MEGEVKKVSMNGIFVKNVFAILLMALGIYLFILESF